MKIVVFKTHLYDTIALIYFIAKRIRNFGKVTVPDIFEIRYGRTAAVLATITTVVAYLTIVSYQFRGGGKVLSMVSDGYISLEAGIVITAVFAISYTVLAGMFSVVYTDVVNGVLMTVGVLAALVYMIYNHPKILFHLNYYYTIYHSNHIFVSYF